MMKRVKLTPNERLLTESPINQYRVVGPGWIWLKPRQRDIAKIYVGPKGEALQYTNVRTAENIPTDISVRLLYRVDPELFHDDLLSKLKGLNDGGWTAIIQWQTEYVLRMLIAHYGWLELTRQEIKTRLERQLTQTLLDRLKMVGLHTVSVCLVRIDLPQTLQETLIQAEQDKFEALGRAQVLSNYRELFGDDLVEAMPYIIQWELANTIHRHTPQILLTPTLPQTMMLPDNDTLAQGYQLQLPLHLNRD